MKTVEEIRAELRAYSECQTTDKTVDYRKWNSAMKEVYEMSLVLKKLREKISVLDLPVNYLLVEERDRYEKFFKRILDLSESTNDHAHLLNLIGDEIKQFK